LQASSSVVLAFSSSIDILWFLTEGKLATVLITPSAWGSQLTGYNHHQLHASHHTIRKKNMSADHVYII
jgi:hypothetical protein